MTKKDFEAIAAHLRDGRDALMASTALHLSAVEQRAAHQIHASTCGSIALVLAKQNARFNRAKFLAACGVSPANTI